jgi:alpha-glucosidase
VRAWWGDLYRSLLEIGIDAFWNDMNEPAVGNILNPDKEARASGTTMSGDVLHGAGGGDPTGPDGPPVRHAEFHNAYGMEMARATYEGLVRLRPDIRQFVLTRSGTAGMQRYASLWTGDNTSKWEYVSMAIPMCLNIGMSGVPFVGVDIGGFYEACNGELLVRFGQLGALLPFCRNHNTMNSPAQEPWAFGEPYESAFRLAIELRYRLMPYLYTLFHDASTTGAPVMRPLYYHYPQDPQACDNDSEFLVGEALLSTPILEQGATGRQVYLPAGYWFDYWDGTIYSGTSWHYIPASLDRWPLFVRSNSILPTGPLMQYTNQHPTDPLTISCYMLEGGQTSFTLYEDDGATFAYAHGDYALISMSCKVEHNIPIVKIEERFDRYRPQRQWYEIVVHFGNQVRKQRVKAGQGMMSVQLSS